MTEVIPSRQSTTTPAGQQSPGTHPTLVTALLGFFVITLDAVIVNVALPAIGRDLGGGMAGQQWVVDGYTLMFAALLLSAGTLSDRLGARRAFATGLTAFVAASVACGLAPGLAALVVARFVQGSAAAVMMPSSMALIGQAYPNPTRRARAVAVWAMGGAVAASSGPVLGGLLTLLSWRLIFFVNVPVGMMALLLLARTAPSPHWKVPFDWFGQVTAVVAMGALTFGAIEAGAGGLTAPCVVIAFVVTLVALTAFVAAEARAAHPMVPPRMFRRSNVMVSNAIGFAFMVGYFGLPFVMSLYLQQIRGLSPLATGLAFLPMMLTGMLFTPASARLVERLGARTLIAAGLILMTAGLAIVAVLPSSTPVRVLSGLMVLVGLAGPFVSPPITAVLLNSVPRHQAGTASGVFNTSRQVGGALAVAVFGALLAQPATFMQGMRTSLLLASGVALATAAAASLLLRPSGSSALAGPVRHPESVRTGSRVARPGRGRHALDRAAMTLAGLKGWLAERLTRHGGNADVVRPELSAQCRAAVSLRTGGGLAQHVPIRCAMPIDDYPSTAARSRPSARRSKPGSRPPGAVGNDERREARGGLPSVDCPQTGVSKIISLPPCDGASVALG